MEITSNVKPVGEVEMIIEYSDGRREIKNYKNSIMRKGREALASSLAAEIGDSYNFYISRMLFGDGGTSGGVKKSVNTTRNGLFGITRVNKPVISSIDPDVRTMVIFTSVMSKSEGNGYTLNEMALQMNTGDLYSMLTFPGVSKTEEMQITFNWRLNFL